MSETNRNGRRTTLDAALDGLALVCKLLTGTALVVLTLIFGWLVWGRYVMNDTPTWVEQVALLLIMLITFLGAAVGIHESSHLGVSYFRDVAPPKVRMAFTLLTHLVMAGFGGLMAWHSHRLVLFKWSAEIPLIHLPEGLRAVPIMICGALVCLFSIGHLVAMAQGRDVEPEMTE